MNDIHIDGISTLQGGSYGKVSLDGVVKCREPLQAEELHIDGIFRCEAGIQTGVFDCDGIAKLNGDVKAASFKIDGMLKITGGTRLEADSINCDGMIRINGEISADTIRADGYISADEIVGDDIRIHSCAPRLFRRKKSRIKLIEATTVELRGVTADTVNGKDIIIGPRCRIGQVDCSGTLQVDRRAKVGNISGTHERKDL